MQFEPRTLPWPNSQAPAQSVLIDHVRSPERFAITGRQLTLCTSILHHLNALLPGCGATTMKKLIDGGTDQSLLQESFIRLSRRMKPLQR